MNLQQIKQSVNDGKVVCWENDSYLVEKGGPWGYWVVKDGRPIFGVTEASIGNCENNDFFILENP